MLNENIHEITIEQTNVAGQKSSLREANAADMERLLELGNSPEFQKYMGKGTRTLDRILEETVEAAEKPTLKNLLTTGQQEDTPKKLLYIISGSKNLSTKEELGNMQGMVGLLKCERVDASKPIKRYIAQQEKDMGLASVKDTKYPVLEITYARYPNSEGGQVASGVRQALWELYLKTTEVMETTVTEENGKRYMVKKHFNKITDTEPDSTEGVSLEENELPDTGVKMEFLTPLVVLAYIDPENHDSMRTAEAAGLVRITEDEFVDVIGDHIYQVDWNVLVEKIQASADKEWTRKF
ncbi:hypothetical protein KAZ57_00110 [Patescibacteria group bacterium]|nr:hypothetical protein [Patescibacteria group bacterium]